MTYPLLPFKWLDVAQFVYDQYLSKPYTSTNIKDDWQFTHSNITIPRPNHGLIHTLRTASYVSLVVQAYNHFNQPSLTATDTDHLQLACLFYVTGRENEAAFGNPEYLRFRQKSADAFERYVRQKLPQAFTEQQLQFYKQGIYDSYSTSPPQYVILRLCHDLDLLRCYPQAEYGKKIQSAKKYVGTFAEPLAALAEECLRQTGDRIMGKQTYDCPLFTLCSTHVEETLRRIDQLLQNHQGAFMQPVQPTAPIPPGLKAPVPKTPWNITSGLFARIQGQPDEHFVRCEVLPTDPEAAFVLQYFMHSKPHGYAIRKIYCIHNPDQTQSFEGSVKIIEREAENAVFAPKGKTEAPQQDRTRVIERWQASTANFSPVKIKGPKRTDKFSEVKVLPLWHGSNQQKCNSICISGFTFFGKHHNSNKAAGEGANASTDIGYFGSGIYFTNSACYAAMYADGHLLLSWVSMREPYPVVNDAPHPNQGSDMKKLMGKEHYQNYNAHYIPVASIKPHKPDCMEYYPCYGNQVPAWDEFVVFDKSQALPRFWIELGVDSPGHPLMNPFVAAVSVAQTAPAVQKKIEPVQPAVVAAKPKAQAVAPVQAAKAKLPAWVFGAAEWNKYFGGVGAEPPLPDDIVQRLPELSKNNVLVLIPATVNGKPLTLKTLGEFVQNPHNGGNKAKYGYLNPGGYDDQPAKSHWALLTRTVIEGSRNKSYQDQQVIVAAYSEKTKIAYEIPTVLDAAVCNMMEYVRSGTWLYGENPATYTWCEEKFNANYNLVVGGSGSILGVYGSTGALESNGVGGLCKFDKLELDSEISMLDRLTKLFRLQDSSQHPLIDPFVAAAALPQPVPAVQKKTEPAKPAAVPATLKAKAAAPVQAAKAKLPAWVFGASEWNKYFGDVGAEPPLPDDIIQRLPELSKNNVLVLIPAAVNGHPLTLKILGKLVQKPLQGHASKYNDFKIGEYADQPAKSHWALLTRTVIEGSQNKTYKDEQIVLESYSQKTKIPYEAPNVLDATVCNFMEYVRSETWLYSENLWTWTWCQENNAGCYLVVGGGSGSGLSVNNCYGAFGFYGVGGLRKF